MAPPNSQFSLSALLLTVAAVAVVFSIFLVPSRLGDVLLIAIIICLSAFTLVGIVYGDVNVRPFCLGSSVPLGLILLYIGTHLADVFDMWWFLTVEPNRPYEVRKMMATAVIAAIALGYLCVGFRGLIERREG